MVVCTGDVGRSEGPGCGGDISSVVGGGMGVFESDFECPVPFSFIFWIKGDSEALELPDDTGETARSVST